MQKAKVSLWLQKKPPVLAAGSAPADAAAAPSPLGERWADLPELNVPKSPCVTTSSWCKNGCRKEKLCHAVCLGRVNLLLRAVRC